MSAKERFDQITHLYRSGQFEKAAAGVALALRVTPSDANFLHLGGLIAEAQQNLPRAEMMMGRALDQRPASFEIQFNLARVLNAQQKHEAAIQLMTRAAETRPDLPQIWESLAQFAHQAGDFVASVGYWDKALALVPHQHEWRAQKLLIQRHMCAWDVPMPDLADLPPQATTVLCDDPVRQKLSAVTTGQARFGSITPMPRADWVPEGRLKIGYLSSDFHAHATSYLLAELFALHDKEQFEIWVYSYGIDDGSDVRERIAASVEHFVDMRAHTPASAAERIRADKIDILIDLKGYTRGSRLEILAHRPAARQLHWLGYPGTLGTPFIDFFVADAVTVPFGAEKNFTEQVLRLPNCYQINDRQRKQAPPESREAYGLPENALVLASFNQTYKITPDVFDIWCRILARNTTSVLWLYESNPIAAVNLRLEAEKRGIEAARLIFAPPKPLPEHLARYAYVDLALDTFPVGGHTTTSDALWCATPVVTWAGQSFVARVAASLLSAVGCGELIAPSAAAYEKLIQDMIDNPARRRQIRRHLDQNRATLPLFDTPRFVKDWENLLRQIFTPHR